MIELILTTILISSLLGIGVILYRKFPVLAKLPEAPVKFKESLVLKMKSGVKKIPGKDKFDHDLYLQKILSRVQILTLKTENKTSHWLERLRQKNNQKNNHNNEKYWEELKKAKNGK